MDSQSSEISSDTVPGAKKKISEKLHSLIDVLNGWHTSFIASLDSKYAGKFTEVFEHNLIHAKGGIIIFLILISIIYHWNYGSIQYSKTYLQSKFFFRAVTDSLITGLLGFLSVAFLMYLRYGNVLHHLKGPLTVSFILMLFNFVQESSGLNRYLDKKNIEEGKGNYAEIDKINTSDDSDQLNDIESGGDPFWNSVGYLSMIIIGMVLLYKFIVMITATVYGYKSGVFSINKINYYGLSMIKSNYAKFGIELLIISLLNSLAYALSPLIRGDMEYNGLTSKVYLIKAGIMFVLAMGTQTMFQWSGML